MIEYEKFRSNVDYYFYVRKDINLCFPSNLHNSFELIFVESGALNVTIGQSLYVLEEGKAALIWPNQPHTYSSDNSNSLLCIFSQSYIYDFYELTKNKYAVNPVFTLDPHDADSLNIDGQNVYFIKSCLYKIVSEFVKNTTFVPRSSSVDAFMEKIISYVENNFCDDITLKKLAANIGYDYHYLSSMFNKIFNCNFLAFVNEYRINFAKNKLLTTSAAITEIAKLCGYNSLRSFNRNFYSFSGHSPIEYRKRLKPHR